MFWPRFIGQFVRPGFKIPTIAIEETDDEYNFFECMKTPFEVKIVERCEFRVHQCTLVFYRFENGNIGAKSYLGYAMGPNKDRYSNSRDWFCRSHKGERFYERSSVKVLEFLLGYKLIGEVDADLKQLCRLFSEVEGKHR